MLTDYSEHQPARSSSRNTLTQALRRANPRLDEHVWTMQRWRDVQVRRRGLSAQVHALKKQTTRSFEIHAVIVIHLGPDAPSYEIAGQNHFFEIKQSLMELLGEAHVTVFEVGPHEIADVWHRRLLDALVESQATHLISQIETDPNQPENWTWDVVADNLARGWDGTWVGVMWDSAYPWLKTRAVRLGRIYDRLLIAELCEPLTGAVRRGRIEAGPLTLPLSTATITRISERVKDAQKRYEVSFIGALYDYRIELLDHLKALGIPVTVNPHRTDSPRTFDESRSNQPHYLDYMRALAESETTINFSLASGGPFEQYKIRIQEAAMVGCLPVTDDRDRTRHFFAPDEYAFFANVEELGSVLDGLLSDRQTLRRRQQAARERASELATTDFWGRIDDAARARGFRAITGLTAPKLPEAGSDCYN